MKHSPPDDRLVPEDSFEPDVDNYNPDDDQQETLPPLEQLNKKLFLGGVGVFVIIALISGSLLYFWNSDQKTADISPVAVSPSPSYKPSESPKPVLNRSEINIEVLNGSGKSGAAKAAADKLAAAGYKIIKTGNAAKSDYSRTEVAFAAGVKNMQAEIMDEIKKLYPEATLSGELTGGDEVSVRLTVGRD